jgi:glycosyltransferase involved in cell wall biosynthesis
MVRFYLSGGAKMKSVDIVIPVYNEEKTIREILKRVEEADFCGLEKHIIIVDDDSRDSTREILKEYEDKYKILYHSQNRGKGAAVYTGFQNTQSDIVVIQDADLEYDPNDYSGLLKLIIEDKADVVYGTRLTSAKPSRSFMFTHYLGNKFLTLLTNVLYGCTLTDMETCYKAFKTEFIKDLVIRSNKFDFEPEVTAKIIKKGARLFELPISTTVEAKFKAKKLHTRMVLTQFLH